MKRFLLCILLLAAASGLGLWAEKKNPEPGFPLAMELYLGAYYDVQAVPTDISLDPSALAYLAQSYWNVPDNFRYGVGFDFEARLGQIGGFGGEVGAYYNASVDSSGRYLGSFLDLPYRLKLSLIAGRAFKLDLFGGVAYCMWIDSNHLLYYPYLDAGGRMSLGPIYLEGSYEFAFGSEYECFPRFGLGVCLPISR
jgi:hypothetical protein